MSMKERDTPYWIIIVIIALALAIFIGGIYDKVKLDSICKDAGYDWNNKIYIGAHTFQCCKNVKNNDNSDYITKCTIMERK